LATAAWLARSFKVTLSALNAHGLYHKVCIKKVIFFPPSDNDLLEYAVDRRLAANLEVDSRGCIVTAG
jgi:hypothetical protein